MLEFNLEIYAQIWQDGDEYVYNVFVGPRDDENILAYGTTESVDDAVTEVRVSINSYLGGTE